MFRSLALLGVLTLACNRTSSEGLASNTPKAAARPTAAAVSPPPAMAAPSDVAEHPFRFPAAARVVAVGDLHGDLASTREAFQLARAIDEHDQWIGGKLVLVQLGDQLDRGDDEPEILRLFERLSREAAQSGGAVHALNGNHELMNVVGDLRYVTEDGFHDYGSTPLPSTAKILPGLPAEARGRTAAFAPGSALARKLSERNVIAIVGDTVFVHGGVLAKHVRYGVGRINDEVRRFLRGDAPALPEIVAADDAPVWTRVYGVPEPTAEVCRELDAVLSALSVKRMVVGHTIQNAGITSACDGHVFRIDVALSDYYGKNPTQVLELGPGGVKILGAAVPQPPLLGKSGNGAPSP